jgi:hypothetical protein
MTCRRFSMILRFSIVSIFASLSCATVFAQGPVPDAPVPAAAVEPVAPAFVASTKLNGEHKFWDKENFALFAAAAASNGADFAVTRANLQSGGQELNPIVRVFGRSSAGLAVNFAGETAGVAGLSYFFHRTGHHKMERMAFLVDTGASIGAVSYGLTHRYSATNSVSNSPARRAASFSLKINLTAR